MVRVATIKRVEVRHLTKATPALILRNYCNHSGLYDMTKRDLVIQISEETGLAQQQVMQIVQRTLDLIAGSVAAGKSVELRNFGVFGIKVRKARIGRNPNDPGKDVMIPPRAVVKFKPGKEMRQSVLQMPTPQV
jgi:DNA-binding protein HU-beta/integration host factor subunit alpha